MMGYGSGVRLLSFLCLFFLISIGCRAKDYSLLHPLQPSPGICRESEIFDCGQVRIHWVAYCLDQRGLLPAVLIHPDAGGLAEDMAGICLDLARHGYFAAAAHYQRLDNLKEENPLIGCRSFEEGSVAYKHLVDHPRVDSGHVALIGFSKGGTHSLLLAATEPGVKAVVAYYPLIDFEEWLDKSQYSFPKSLRFWAMRRQIMRALKVEAWEEALPELRTASPINHVARIHAPVLLIHGGKDRTVPVGQSERLCQALKAAGKRCELFVIPEAGHVFNFRNEDQARVAWEKTLQFLDQHLKR
jgi:dienelactone hydrolase